MQEDLEGALHEHKLVKRSTPEYYFCLATESSNCNTACGTQCQNKNAFGKTFKDGEKCYEVLATGSCPVGDNTCSSGFKCSCDINEISCPQ